jgi:alpha-methylacyl-CoA racemase
MNQRSAEPSGALPAARADGPLQGVRVVEVAGLGPAAFAAMMLSDMGAEVIQVKRVESVDGSRGTASPLERGRRSIALNLKQQPGVDAMLRLVAQADALIEGFRPGVMERLGLGPDVCLRENRQLVYGRMTGWGQTGPVASTPGHDINYIALCGTLAAIGPRGGPPVPPLTVVGDFGGGGMLMAFGLLCGILEARTSGVGQVIDAAMIDGISLLMNPFFGFNSRGQWNEERGTNYIDGGAPFYGVYECSDGKFISIGAIEPKFHEALLSALNVDSSVLSSAKDRSSWDEERSVLEAVFRSKTRSEWCELLEDIDTCFAPVLSMNEAPHHPHHMARGTYLELDGMVQANAAPRFSRTPGSVKGPPSTPGEHTVAVLRDLGFTERELASLQANGTIAVAGEPVSTSQRPIR